MVFGLIYDYFQLSLTVAFFYVMFIYVSFLTAECCMFFFDQSHRYYWAFIPGPILSRPLEMFMWEKGYYIQLVSLIILAIYASSIVLLIVVRNFVIYWLEKRLTSEKKPLKVTDIEKPYW